MCPVYRVFESLDALVTVVEEARGLPMTSNCVVPRGDVLELLDDIREALPGELDDAQDVLDRRDELVDDATQEAEQTRSGAQADAAAALAAAHTEADRLPAAARPHRTPRAARGAPGGARPAPRAPPPRGGARGGRRAQAVHRAHRPGPQG